MCFNINNMHKFERLLDKQKIRKEEEKKILKQSPFVENIRKLRNLSFLFLFMFVAVFHKHLRCWRTLMGMPLHNLIKSVDENVIKYIHAVTKRKNVASSAEPSSIFLSSLRSNRRNVSHINHFS